LIFEDKILTVERVNHCISTFDYSPMESWDKPTTFKIDTCKDRKKR